MRCDVRCHAMRCPGPHGGHANHTAATHPLKGCCHFGEGIPGFATMVQAGVLRGWVVGG